MGGWCDSEYQRPGSEELWGCGCEYGGLAEASEEGQAPRRTVEPVMMMMMMMMMMKQLIVVSNFISQLNICGYSPHVTSSLTRGWVSNLQLLLVLASAAILRSETWWTLSCRVTG
jgi:hypothetical protein